MEGEGIFKGEGKGMLMGWVRGKRNWAWEWGKGKMIGKGIEVREVVGKVK